MKSKILLLCGLFTVVFARKNVLFFAVDDLRPQLGCYEHSDFPSPVHPKMHTPNIDALASKSLLLRRAYVQQAVCSPSRTSLLTGRRPDTTHVYDLESYFRDVGGNFTTIPEYFKNNGYISAGMGKIFHPGQASGGDDPISWSLPYFHGKRYWEHKEKSWQAIPDSDLDDKPLIDFQIAAKAKRTLKMFATGGKHEGTPFFIAVGFHRPHLPFVFPKSFLQYYPEESVHLPPNPYAPAYMPSVAWSSYAELRRNYEDQKKINASGKINTTLPDNDVLALRRAYYSTVSWIDSLIGVVLKQLVDYGFENNTIISFWGDHGWQLGEHGEWCKHTNFELATHAPMMVHIPGRTDEGIVTEKLAELVDLFPTLVEAAELEPMPLCPEISKDIALCREGESLIPFIMNPDVKWKDAAFSQYPRYMNRTNIMGYTIRTNKYRYTEWPKFSYAPDYKPDWLTLFGVELYAHEIDPEENYNRAFDANFKEIRRELSHKLRLGWRAARPGSKKVHPRQCN